MPYKSSQRGKLTKRNTLKPTNVGFIALDWQAGQFDSEGTVLTFLWVSEFRTLKDLNS